MDKENENRYALLIDADNISPRYMNIIISEAKEFGAVSIRRSYADWTDVAKNSWKETLLENSITPIQQYTYTSGKNASDSAMIIDAMDILYGNDVNGFIIASSDSDFTRLAVRLREAGKDIVGMGESKTPSAFVKACRVFKTLDVLYKATNESVKKKETGKGSPKVEENKPAENILPITSIESIKNTIVTLVDTKSDEEGWLFLGNLGNYLLKEYPDFDCRNYGYKKLTELLEACEKLDIKIENSKSGKQKLLYARIK